MTVFWLMSGFVAYGSQSSAPVRRQRRHLSSDGLEAVSLMIDLGQDCGEAGIGLENGCANMHFQCRKDGTSG